jgi:hypothetical protein
MNVSLPLHNIFKGTNQRYGGNAAGRYENYQNGAVSNLAEAGFNSRTGPTNSATALLVGG